jgi:hypothetical protein
MAIGRQPDPRRSGPKGRGRGGLWHTQDTWYSDLKQKCNLQTFYYDRTMQNPRKHIVQRIMSLLRQFTFSNETGEWTQHTNIYIYIWLEVLTAVSMKMAVCWVVPPCRLVWVYRRFRGPYYLHRQDDESPVTTSATLVNFYQSTRRYNPEDSHLQHTNMSACPADPINNVWNNGRISIKFNITIIPLGLYLEQEHGTVPNPW